MIVLPIITKRVSFKWGKLINPWGKAWGKLIEIEAKKLP